MDTYPTAYAYACAMNGMTPSNQLRLFTGTAFDSGKGWTAVGWVYWNRRTSSAWTVDIET